MRQYLNFLRDIRDCGISKSDRTGVGTISRFGYQMRFDLRQAFPVVTTKKIHLKSVIYELLWFLRGDTNVDYLHQHGVTIWDEWADEEGNLGPIYGKQWRAWETTEGRTIDQIAQVIDQIKHYPDSRRHIVSAWNVGDIACIPQAPPPCHLLFQFYVVNRQLSCFMYQRSADAFLGVPFNITSYALLTYMVAQQCDLEVSELIWSAGDCHIYNNHIEQVNVQLARQPYPLPHLNIKRKPPSLFEYNYEDFEIENYRYHPSIKAPIAV